MKDKTIKDKFKSEILKAVFNKMYNDADSIEESAIACNTLHQQAMKEKELKIGKYTISKCTSYPDGKKNKIWVVNEDGEGTSIDMDELWNKHF